MNLNEAIEHLKTLLQKNEFNCEECKNEHKQLLDWLIELKELKNDK